ncbi:MAG: TIGR02270 family protein [bacterium]
MNKVIPEIIQQHAEEAAFLWLLRDQAVNAPHYSLADLAELDNRVETHIDGLRIAGEAGWEICDESLDWQEPGEVFAAAVLAFETGREERIQKVLEVASTSIGLSGGLVSALGWLPHEHVAKQIQQLLSTDSSALRHAGIAGCGVHRQDPGAPLKDAFSHEDERLRSRALRAAGELGRADLLPHLFPHFQDDNELCRFSAAWSAALLGDARATTVLQSVAEQDVPFREEAARMAVRRMKPAAAFDWLKRLPQSPQNMRLALIAGGAIGEPSCVPWLIDQMSVPELARVAGEAFSMITGVDIAYDDLEGEWPAGFEAGPTENPEDENVEMDGDEDLPWPEQELIHRWWQEQSSRFQKGKRYLCGQPITADSLMQVLRRGKQRQRAAAAIELALLQPGKPLFEVRAPGFRQQKMLTANQEERNNPDIR